MPTLTENVSACDPVFAQRAQRRLHVGLAGAAQLVGDHAAAARQLEQAVARQALDARALAAAAPPDRHRQRHDGGHRRRQSLGAGPHLDRRAARRQQRQHQPAHTTTSSR